MLVFIPGEFRKNLASLSREFAASADRKLKFDKRRQLFIGTNNKAVVVAICGDNIPAHRDNN
jgi:hypothetical protein